MSSSPADTISPHRRVSSPISSTSAPTHIAEAFAENFNQAVSSDILSIGYAVHQAGGYSWALRFDRYQGLKQAATATPARGADPYLPLAFLDLFTTEHKLPGLGVLGTMESSVSALKRVQPNFATTGLTERIDIHPELALPIKAGGWNLRPSIGVRETAYTRSREHSPQFDDSSGEWGSG